MIEDDKQFDRALAELPERPEGIAPQHDLWPGIEARLDEQAAAPRVRTPWRYAMAASLVGVLVTGLVLAPQAPEPAPITVASGPAASPSNSEAAEPWAPMLAEFRQAEQAIRASTQQTAATTPRPQDAEPLAGSLELERAITKLENQSAALREQLKTDPNNIDNIQTLARVERRRLELIRLITTLDQAPDGGFSNADASF